MVDVLLLATYCSNTKTFLLIHAFYYELGYLFKEY